MAFGFPASFIQYILFNNVSKIQFLYFSIKSCKQLNWSILEINDRELIAETYSKEESWNEKITINFEDEDASILSSSNGNQIYDRGRNRKNTDLFFDVFNNLKKENPISGLEPENILHEINSEKEKICSTARHDYAINNFYSFLSPFIPTKDYIITPIIIHLNILIFFLMFFSGVNFFTPKTTDIINWGANYSPLTVEGQWWRLITCFFVHNGFIHLIVNCFALAYAGLLLESYLSKLGFLTTYLFSGILASLTSLYWHDKIISVGASGAIFGMYGILILAVATKAINKKLNPRTITLIIVFVSLNILNSFKEEIDGAAHIGGLLSGILFGTILSILSNRRKIAILTVTIVSIIAIPLFGVYCKSKKIYIYQIFEYETRMQEFVDMEKMALEAYNIYATDEESKNDLLYMIESRGIYYWEENIKLLNELDQLFLPKELHKQNKTLLKYCQLRIKSYQLAYKKIDKNTTMYDGPIMSLDYQINELLKELQKDKKE